MLFEALGIDVSKAKLDVALIATTKAYKVATFANEKDGWRRLAKWLKKHKAQEIPVCLEATGRYGEGVAFDLHERGYRVSVVNPARIKAYGQSQLSRNKTDRQDAKLIAHFCATQKPAFWTPPTSEIRELQALGRRLETLKTDRTRELNRLESGLTSETVLTAIQEHIAFLDKQIEAIEAEMQKIIDQDPDLRQQKALLTSIPGIGDLTAAKFMAEVPDVARFESASQLAAYAGLTPRQHDSGSSIHRPGRLVKTGNVHFRTTFYMPSLSAMRCNPVIRSLVTRLQDKGKSRMTIVGAVMRKLVHLAFGVLKSKRPFDPDYLLNLQVTA
ncbi:MAG: transposase [Ardenticatenaceae bacterium]|nr:transposase [Ardenticatenaceae bacterium]